MRSLFIFGAAFYALAVWLVWTQVAVPLWRGRPPFPLFRRRVREIEEEIADLREQTDIAEQRKLADSLRSSLN